MTYKLEEHFDVNVIKLLAEASDSGIKTGPNYLGASDIPFCQRANIIKALYEISINMNNKMLFGILYENALYQKPVLMRLISYLHSKATFEEKLTEVDTKKEDYWEIIPGCYIRLHPDIYTNLYTIEIKTTGIYVKEWKRELAKYQYAQLNTYLGYYKQEIGFLHKMNSRAFLSGIKYNEFYWEKLWESYGYFLPARFNKKIFDLTVDRAIETFGYIKEEIFDGVPGPEMIWECAKGCSEEIRKICGKAIVRKDLDYYQNCDKCNDEISEGSKALFRNELVFCEKCEDYVKELV